MKRLHFVLLIALGMPSFHALAAGDCWEEYTACAVPFNDKHNEGCKTKYNACIAPKNAEQTQQGAAAPASQAEEVLRVTACSYRAYSGSTNTTTRQDLPASNWTGSNSCKVRLPYSYVASEVMRIYNLPLSRGEIEILGATWKGDCTDGKASGTGTLLFGLSPLNACKPGHWFSISGSVRQGEFEGQVAVVHNAHQGFPVTRGETYLHGSYSYANERDYQEALNPDRRRQRFEYERQEREKIANQQRAEEESLNKLLNSSKPRTMIMAASDFETNGEKSKAKSVYLAIKQRHPNSQEALLAIQRLARMADVEATVAANHAAASRVERAENLRREQSYDKCMNEKLSCQTSCDGIQNSDSRFACKERCYQYCSK